MIEKNKELMIVYECENTRTEDASIREQEIRVKKMEDGK